MVFPKWLSIKMDPPWMEFFLPGPTPQLQKKRLLVGAEKNLDLFAGPFARHLH